MIKKKLNTVATLWDGGCFGTQATRVWTWFELFSLDWICLEASFTLQHHRWRTLQLSVGHQDKIHEDSTLSNKNQPTPHTWWFSWASDFWSPEVVRIKGSCTYLWLGSQRRVSSRFDGGQWGSLKFWHRFVMVLFSWRTPSPQGRLEIQVPWMIIWQIWWYRIMMFHAPVNQWEVLVCMLSLQAMNVMSHKHHDITNPSSYQ